MKLIEQVLGALRYSGDSYQTQEEFEKSHFSHEFSSVIFGPNYQNTG